MPAPVITELPQLGEKKPANLDDIVNPQFPLPPVWTKTEEVDWPKLAIGQSKFWQDFQRRAGDALRSLSHELSALATEGGNSVK
jgi:hypothetical protein